MWWSFKRYENYHGGMTTMATWRIPGTRNTYPIVFNLWHGFAQCGHGPQTWPWWRLISFKLVDCREYVSPPTTTTRLWYYTRWVSGHIDLTIDRRVWGRR